MRNLWRVAVVACCLGGTARPASAQELLVKFDRILRTVDIDANRAYIEDVVQQLFSQAGAPRIDMDRDVRGRVTLHLHAVTRESALAKALEQVDAGYRVEGNTYLIRPNRSNIPRQGDRPGPGRRGDTGGSERDVKLDDAPAAFKKHVDMVANDRPIGEIVRVLARTGGVTITVDRSIPGDLTLDVMAKDEALWVVLQRMANASHLKLDVLGPTDVIFRPQASFSAYYRGRRIGGSSGEMFACRNCRFNELKRGWRFCPMCGERIERQ